MTSVAITAIALLLPVVRAAPTNLLISTRRKPFLGGRRGARIGFIAGMVILGLILAGIAFWCLIACCCAGAASRRRGPGSRGATAPPMGTTTTAGLHHAGPGAYAAPAGPPPGANAGAPAFPQPAHKV